jgi:hypothetical protein
MLPDQAETEFCPDNDYIASDQRQEYPSTWRYSDDTASLKFACAPVTNKAALSVTRVTHVFVSSE